MPRKYIGFFVVWDSYHRDCSDKVSFFALFSKFTTEEILWLCHCKWNYHRIFSTVLHLW